MFRQPLFAQHQPSKARSPAPKAQENLAPTPHCSAEQCYQSLNRVSGRINDSESSNWTSVGR